jgi:lipopolysaccharide transport system ATP-binding protein
MSDVIISVENLGKKYRISHQGEKQRYVALRDVIAQKAKGFFKKLKSGNAENLKSEAAGPISAFQDVSVSPSQNVSVSECQRVSVSSSEDFWALKDVSFEVKRGEVVGIIGRNGAGKSTLLKILSRITEPTEGRVTLKGQVASLLEVGTGFHPELTGRENIFLNGAILGMSRAEIRKKFDEIVAFAEVEKFLDTPVKRYSSGMYVRLAFAVAAHLEPEILIVDEVLAVGDAAFQNKCLGKMEQVSKREGRTILFVSHNMSAVRHLCRRGILLKAGSVICDASAEECVSAYTGNRNAHSNQILDHITKQHPDIEIKAITANGDTSDKVILDDDHKILRLHIEGILYEAMRLEIEAVMSDSSGNRLAFFSPGHELGNVAVWPSGPFALTREIEFPVRMNKGEYYLSLYLTDPNVSSWASVEQGILLMSEGTPMKNGRTLSYNEGAGLILLDSPKQNPMV